MAEFAVGYRDSPGFGAPFAPMTEEQACNALVSLSGMYPDAVLITRAKRSEAWREVPTPEGQDG